MSSELERNKATVLAHFEALDSARYERLPELHLATGRNHAQAPFDVSTWPPEGVPFGPDQVRQTFTWLRSAMPDLRAQVEQLVAEDDQVVAWVRLTGSQSGALDGVVDGTGGAIEVHHAHRFRLEDGRIAEHWAVRDDLRAMVLTGVVRPPARPA